ncbi:hypothetical protein MPTK1_6g08340 [Marchantia polymorpha subsp. ruderalis]|uniref:Uncharacterized protein n=2 Tax=Marchantia polymorpha TaxID=3197 RepID=A0AAF6BPV0_MARPO|nr:hypothetical protein MARPO_0060s0087 [Marchantia polymorpha]BBN14034.1 hypothetical protein Mp_6g08340 [Marchantia polymorpha subsp. ruderalis]|eukprot:PTQ37011.1 hypothetical protein MARPO_0060s0087 [Marchantia polymorpha]
MQLYEDKSGGRERERERERESMHTVVCISMTSLERSARTVTELERGGFVGYDRSDLRRDSCVWHCSWAATRGRFSEVRG